MIFPNQLVIIGGGPSIKEGLGLGLKDKLKDTFTLGCNYAFKFIDSTATCYVDKGFFNMSDKKLSENLKEQLTNLPLVIGQGKKLGVPPPNTVFIPCAKVYARDCANGIYKSNLCGIYTLSLGIYLLNIGTIFLLGYDHGAITKDLDAQHKVITHFYQDELKHRGIGKANWYNKNDGDIKDYGVYKDEKHVKIYNVSLNSHIRLFPKISYEQFFSMLSPTTYPQDQLRSEILIKLKNLPQTQA